MKTFRNHLKEELKDPEFKKLFDEEKKILELSMRILEYREKNKLSQKELSQRAGITQQQLSKLENGSNCNVITFLKVCNALHLNVSLKPEKKLATA